jgi:hypothetical protein
MRQRRRPKIKVWVWGYRGSTVGGCAVKWWGHCLDCGCLGCGRRGRRTGGKEVEERRRKRRRKRRGGIGDTSREEEDGRGGGHSLALLRGRATHSITILS